MIASTLALRLPLIVAVIVVVGVGLELLPIALARLGAVVVLAAQIHQERKSGDSQFLTSPLFLLGTIALVFYSIILGVSDTSFPGLPFDNLDTVYGSAAERMFVIFGLCCIAAHSLVAGQGAVKPVQAQAISGDKKIYLFTAIALIVSLVNVVNFLSLESGGLHITDIRSVAPALLSFCLVYLVYLSLAARGRQKMLIFLVVALTIAALFFIHEGKKPVFMALAGLWYWLRLKNVPLKHLTAVGVVVVLALMLAVQIIQIIRVPATSLVESRAHKKNPMEMFNMIVRAKVVLRQTETRHCFNKVVESHGDQPFAVSKQLFWLQGLVPRVVWPEKPALSSGRDYTTDYCGYKSNFVHTASISLLGQPYILGGWLGLVVHGGILIACLGGVAWLGRNPRSITTVACVAMLPWLIDFDQEFALFVANAVKFFLAMLPLIFLATRGRSAYG
jgi:hypothetical protein